MILSLVLLAGFFLSINTVEAFASDFSRVHMEKGESIKSTRAVVIPAGGGTIEIYAKLLGGTPLYYEVINQHGNVWTYGSIYRLYEAKHYERNVPAGTYKVVLYASTYDGKYSTQAVGFIKSFY